MKWLVTGGAGFIGTNLVASLVESGDEAVVLDDLSRGGSERNAGYLEESYGIATEIVDISDREALDDFLGGTGGFDAVAHLAGQVSLMESIRDPLRDFAINAQGTINLLDWVRRNDPSLPVIGMSSNKVYGDLSAIRVIEEPRRYVAPEWPEGFDESLPLDLHGPYGCSKGVVDQYLADYSRTYGMRTASLRQSSVYGPHQHPRSDQGWVAHMVAEALAGRRIELNGVGKQVRDLLHASDLSRLFPVLAGSLVAGEPVQANVGGGPANAMSILELFDWLEESTGRQVDFGTGTERPSDQKVFISDNRTITGLTGWEPEVDLDAGLSGLVEASAG